MSLKNRRLFLFTTGRPGMHEWGGQSSKQTFDIYDFNGIIYKNIRNNHVFPMRVYPWLIILDTKNHIKRCIRK